MIEQKVKPIYRIVVDVLSENLGEGSYRILSDARIVFHRSGRTHSAHFVKNIHHVSTEFGLLKLIPDSDLEYHRKTLREIVKEYPKNKITYTIYDNGCTDVKIENLREIKDEILTVSDKGKEAVWGGNQPEFN